MVSSRVYAVFVLTGKFLCDIEERIAVLENRMVSGCRCKLVGAGSRNMLGIAYAAKL